MTTSTWGTLTLLAATVTTGLVAGLFYAYAISVMPGLAAAGDAAYVEVMQRINVAILNGWFALGFAGAPVLTAVAVVLHLRRDVRSVLPWLVAALVLYALMLVVTFAVNIPLNDRLAAAGDPAKVVDPAAVRAAFEQRWVRWNVVRAVLSTGALACLAWASVLNGRA